MIRRLIQALFRPRKAAREHEARMKVLRAKSAALDVEKARTMENLDRAKLAWTREAARSRELEAQMKDVLKNHPARGHAPQGA